MTPEVALQRIADGTWAQYGPEDVQEFARYALTPGTSLALAGQRTALQARTARRRTVESGLKLGAATVFAYWRDVMGHPGAILDAKREARLIARLRENGADVSELLYCVDGAVRDDWTMGRSANSTKPYNGTETIFRDREKVESLVAMVRDRKVMHPYLEDTGE